MGQTTLRHVSSRDPQASVNRPRVVPPLTPDTVPGPPHSWLQRIWSQLFRSQGDSWPVTVAKRAGLVVLLLTAVAVLGIVIVRLS
jgi:hypothetical protein